MREDLRHVVCRFERIAGRHLRAARLAAGVPLHQAADRLGVPDQQLAKYERGENKLSLGNWLVAVRAIGADPVVLLQAALDELASGAPEPADG